MTIDHRARAAAPSRRAPASKPIRLDPLSERNRAREMTEFVLTGAPAVDTPYDPDAFAIDVTFTGPSGRSVTLPAFWHAPFERRLEKDVSSESRSGGNEASGREVLIPAGEPGWRIRWTPLETGAHRIEARISGATRGGSGGDAVFSLPSMKVSRAPAGARGFARVEPESRRHFMTDDGRPLPLLGMNTCWHGRRGTFDYDDWFVAMAAHRMNYGRLWMWHNAFGIEFFPEERLNYHQERAWRLDAVLGLAAKLGIFAMLCLDYHGVFEEKPDMWGGNNLWTRHAYNRANGGPCDSQNDFFTHPEAAALYRKRLRYLIGRYSAYPSLLSWQFFNEINNVYRYLKPPDVVAWHDAMARWIKARDPYRHPITTSFGSAGEQKEMWRLDSLDTAQWHWYGNWGGPYRQIVEMADDVARRFHRDYGKPVVISEFGTHGGGGREAIESDPNHRGLRQALWGGVMAGTAGTAMTWWWERFHTENVYPLWRSLAAFLDGTGFGSAGWGPLRVTAARTETRPERDDSGASLLAWAMGDARRGTVLAWALDPAFAWPNGAKTAAETVPDGTIEFHDMPDGRYSARWWNTRDGKPLATTRGDGRNGLLRLAVPAFETDVAVRIRRTGRDRRT